MKGNVENVMNKFKSCFLFKHNQYFLFRVENIKTSNFKHYLSFKTKQNKTV